MSIFIHVGLKDKHVFDDYMHIFISYYGAKVIVYKNYDNLQIADIVSYENNINLFIQSMPANIINNYDIIKDKMVIMLVNTEPLAVRFLADIKLLLSKNIKVIDYSAQNLEFTNFDNNHICIPMYYSLKFILPKYPKFYDIGFVGTPTPKRQQILNELSTKCNFIWIRVYGKCRDILIQHCKVLINIHAFELDNSCLETLRCYPVVYNKTIVVSEDSVLVEKNPYHIAVNKYIIFAKYNALVSTCLEILNRYNEFYDNIFRDYDEKKITSLVKEDIELNKDIFSIKN